MANNLMSHNQAWNYARMKVEYGLAEEQADQMLGEIRDLKDQVRSEILDEVLERAKEQKKIIESGELVGISFPKELIALDHPYCDKEYCSLSNYLDQLKSTDTKEGGTIEYGQPLSNYIQWKGTDLCMDWFCEDGHQNHWDGDGAYEVMCEYCSRKYKLGESVIMTKSTDTKEEGINE